jgi:putative sigma-54 modulation protein
VALRPEWSRTVTIYEIVGRHIELTEAMKNYAQEKLGKLDRFADDIVDAKVVMSYNERVGGAPAKVEVQVNVPNGVVRAEERAMDHYAAIDEVVDKLERQLKKAKGRYEAKRSEAKPAPPTEEPAEVPAQIVRTKKHVMRPMAPEDAALEMDALGHDFFVFRNLETDGIAVIYLRQDGHYGLIEPA